MTTYVFRARAGRLAALEAAQQKRRHDGPCRPVGQSPADGQTTVRQRRSHIGSSGMVLSIATLASLFA